MASVIATDDIELSEKPPCSTGDLTPTATTNTNDSTAVEPTQATPKQQQIDIPAFNTTTADLPTLTRKSSFVNTLEQSYSHIGRMLSFSIVTICCFLFIFIRGWPLLQWNPDYSFTPSTQHYQWVYEASDTCVSLEYSTSMSTNTTSSSSSSSGTIPSKSLKGGYLFVVHRHEQVVVAILSYLLDIIVLKYHFTHEPHPKFRMSKRRKYCIYMHLIGGTSEIMLSLFAFLTGIAGLASLAAYPALLFQAPTAMYQAYSVFGSKRVLIPVAQLANAMHVFAAIRLLGNPNSTEALLSMILILHLYVWARAFYSFLNRLRVMREASYTLSIAFSGILVIPAALEFLKPLHIYTSVIVYNIVLLIMTRQKCFGGDPYLGKYSKAKERASLIWKAL
tara:strand:+ start:36 stop:1211 length:1176 start_codon:yes stop_codon:yes gene_type:complete